MKKSLPQNLVTNNNYIVRFAQDEDEVRAAQKLRFRVFNLELGEGLQSSYEHQLDIDKYDEQCHHLLVFDRASDEVIGTYRMQSHEMAQKKHGFYTADEFDLSQIPEAVLARSVEVGRACIEREHRNGRVLYLLWRGIATYITQTESRYLFGCCSLTSQDPEEGWLVMEYLKRNNLTHEQYRVEAMEEYTCPEVEIDLSAVQEVDLPQLFRLYMDLGAKVCSEPAIDREFKTIDYLVILDVESLDERTRMLFFK
ncbi:MAG: GNAT family N-acyltransferase [Balneolaceae bacterium]|nr:GNAT family N-acyltransferase [Balneolaceae bacterium]